MTPKLQIARTVLLVMKRELPKWQRQHFYNVHYICLLASGESEIAMQRLPVRRYVQGNAADSRLQPGELFDGQVELQAHPKRVSRRAGLVRRR